MTIPPTIEPALSAAEWAALCDAEQSPLADRVWFAADEAGVSTPHALIAIANAALPDSDPRKITRKKLAQLRLIVEAWDGVGRDPGAVDRWIESEDLSEEPPFEYFGDRIDGHAILDALASYLPPDA